MRTEHIRGNLGVYTLSAILPDDLLPVTPTILAAHTHNWTIAQLAQYDLILVDASAPVDLTGLVWPTDRRKRYLVHIGTNAANVITLQHQDGNSSAANRFVLPNAAPLALPIGGSVALWYDPTATRIRILVAS